jgi:hypothetical protein
LKGVKRMKKMIPVDCHICGAFHPPGFKGDCRDDDNRFPTDDPIERVIFRIWRDGHVIALLPDVEANPGMCMMYEHVGQHGEGDPRHVVSKTRLATPEEYAPLLAELRRIGYNLRIVKRMNRRG